MSTVISSSKESGRTSAQSERPDYNAIRADFPILSRDIRGRKLVYLDSAASAQKPRQVIDAIRDVYENEYSNVHRGVHYLSQESTRLYEGSREKVRAFLGAARREEIVFVRGATEAINLVAFTWGRRKINAGDEIVITAMEHHSNIVPWQVLCQERGAQLCVAPINDRGEVILDEFEALLGPKTKIVSIIHVSNALGTVNPVREMIAMAKARGITVLLDGAQAVPHLKVDVRDLDCDFYVFSGHKLYGPSGIGALYGRREILDAMPPWQSGGDMISSVTFEKTTYNVLPYKFEAGTPNIAGGIGLGAAIDYVNAIGMDNIAAHESELLAYGTEALSGVDGLKLVGTAADKAGVLSFVLEGIHPHDIGTILDQEGIAVRTGHHCAQPVMDRFGIPATARASLAVYNNKADIDALVEGIAKVKEVFG